MSNPERLQNMQAEIDAQMPGADAQLDAARTAEHRKYAEAYTHDGYRMHGARMENAETDLRALPCRGSLLDVGCGRGHMLDFAEMLGFAPVVGTEVVPYLLNGERIIHAQAHDLPFPAQSFDVVISNDVIEHLLPGDDELMCREMRRVARRFLLITANNMPSTLADGTDLHINKRPYQEWDSLFRDWFSPGVVTWIHTAATHSTERWMVELP
jgi:ubiquinone/menaquinone biosynthesis C-methylase UbiE